MTSLVCVPAPNSALMISSFTGCGRPAPGLCPVRPGQCPGCWPCPSARSMPRPSRREPWRASRAIARISSLGYRSRTSSTRRLSSSRWAVCQGRAAHGGPAVGRHVELPSDADVRANRSGLEPSSATAPCNSSRTGAASTDFHCPNTRKAASRSSASPDPAAAATAASDFVPPTVLSVSKILALSGPLAAGSAAASFAAAAPPDSASGGRPRSARCPRRPPLFVLGDGEAARSASAGPPFRSRRPGRPRPRYGPPGPCRRRQARARGPRRPHAVAWPTP